MNVYFFNYVDGSIEDMPVAAESVEKAWLQLSYIVEYDSGPTGRTREDNIKYLKHYWEISDSRQNGINV